MTYTQLYALRKRAGILDKIKQWRDDQWNPLSDTNIQALSKMTGASPEQIRQYVDNRKAQAKEYIDFAKSRIQPDIDLMNDVENRIKGNIKDKARSVIQAIKSKLGLTQEA